MIFSFPFDVELIKPDKIKLKSAYARRNSSLITLEEKHVNITIFSSSKEIFMDYFVIVSILQRPNSLSYKEKNLVNTIMSKAKEEVRATKKINGYSVLNTKTLEILWISEYDYNNITGYYADDESETKY